MDRRSFLKGTAGMAASLLYNISFAEGGKSKTGHNRADNNRADNLQGMPDNGIESLEQYITSLYKSYESGYLEEERAERVKEELQKRASGLPLALIISEIDTPYGRRIDAIAAKEIEEEKGQAEIWGEKIDYTKKYFSSVVIPDYTSFQTKGRYSLSSWSERNKALIIQNRDWFLRKAEEIIDSIKNAKKGLAASLYAVQWAETVEEEGEEKALEIIADSEMKSAQMHELCHLLGATGERKCMLTHIAYGNTYTALAFIHKQASDPERKSSYRRAAGRVFHDLFRVLEALKEDYHAKRFSFANVPEEYLRAAAADLYLYSEGNAAERASRIREILGKDR